VATPPGFYPALASRLERRLQARLPAPQIISW
jgi:hypothetical protein